MNRYVFTDLAWEAWNSFQNERSEGNFTEKRISDWIRCSKGEMVRREGGVARTESCVTFFSPPLWQLDPDSFEILSHHVALALREMLQGITGMSITREFSVLVVGVGNGEMTADALGPETVKQILVTRHLGKARGTLRRCSVSAMTPGVLGNTGIETVELIGGAVRTVRPNAVIAVDALAARHYERLASTVQISDGGILPGSGIGNIRKAISRETLGCPVLAVGVPMVVNSSTLIASVFEQAGMERISETMQGILDNGKSFFVMPKESDQAVKRAALLLATAIDQACTVESE